MTNKNKWTEGPWELSCGDNGRVLALFNREGDKPYFWEIAAASPVSFTSEVDGAKHSAEGSREANANLIAAAPDLYDALEKIVNSGDWFLTALEIDLDEEGSLDGEQLKEIALSALAKARGETL